VYNIQTDVKLHDQFWLKTQAYSLYDMLNGGADGGKMAQKFEGGTVYQAFLSPADYHRWHAPIDGIIEKVEVGNRPLTTPNTSIHNTLGSDTFG